MHESSNETADVKNNDSRRARVWKKGRLREDIGVKTTTLVLTEAGYRCAVPTCRGILLLDMHHMWEISEGGGDEASNLIALCPTCHALYHRGKIRVESIYAWKAMLISIGCAFDVQTIDRLLFLDGLDHDFLTVSGDGVLHFDRVLAAGFATVSLKANNNFMLVTYSINITLKGRMLIAAWKSGNITDIENALAVVA